MREAKIIFFVIYFLFGLYFINSSLVFYALPDFPSNIEKWIFLIGGLLIIYGSVNFMRLHKNRGMIGFH